MEDLATIHFSKFNELKELYAQVKECILLAENFDPDHSVYLSPVNELRNALDHIMRSYDAGEKIDEEYQEAKEHLYRAGYDAYEVLSINVADKIVEIVEVYPTEIISLIFPYYYTEIKKNLISIKVELANVRARKKTHENGVDISNFTPYKERVTHLIEHLKVCEENIPSLQNEKRTRKNRSYFNNFWGIIIGLVVGVGGLFIYDNYFKREVKPPTSHHISVKKADSLLDK
jgi:hypothetical protein